MPDGWFIKENQARSVQSGLGDFKAADHPPGVFAYEAVGRSRQSHELQCFTDTRLALPTWQTVELCENQEILLAGQGAVNRDRLGYVANNLAHSDRLGRNRETGDPCLARAGRKQRRQHLDRRRFTSAVRSQGPEDFSSVNRNTE